MANFELKISEKSFAKLGVKVGFDETKYAELLDLVAGDTPEPTAPEVKVSPHMEWSHGFFVRLLAAMNHDSQHFVSGQYDPKSTTVIVPATKDVAHTNTALLHETKHWGDDISGFLEAGQKIQKRNAKIVLRATAVGGVAIGATAYAMGGEPMLGLAATVPALPALQYFGYWHTPHEVSARKFMKDPEIVREYGDIISYNQI